MAVPQYNLAKSTISRRKGTGFRPPLSFRGAKPRGNLLGHCANSHCLPGDCHAALRLAMTVVVWGWCFCISWAIIEHGRRGQCHTPYKGKGSPGEPFAAFGGWNAGDGVPYG